jgi:hypothetical protein
MKSSSRLPTRSRALRFFWKFANAPLVRLSASSAMMKTSMCMTIFFSCLTWGVPSAQSASGSTSAARQHTPGAPQVVPVGKQTEPLRFDEKTWAHLLLHGPRPAAYLFTTSYCATCPDAFEVLHRAIKGSDRQVPLAAIFMDIDGLQALKHAKHFQGMTQLYSFDGFEPAIRQAVDPQWQNITPYIVLVDRQGKLQRMLGPPNTKALKDWLSD